MSNVSLINAKSEKHICGHYHFLKQWQSLTFNYIMNNFNYKTKQWINVALKIKFENAWIVFNKKITNKIFFQNI